MTGFEAAYQRLNSAQRAAVDQIEGPLLVIAGPGTGKTQLLSARVANILTKTDTLPQNILCLTFTESGARNMRERLTQFIGQGAYDTTISTYHAFGGELLTRFPEYFTDARLERPIDELSKHQLLSGIVENLPYDNPLKQLRHHLGDLIATISEVKRALLDAQGLRAIARENLEFASTINPDLARVFESFTTMPRSVAKALPFFTGISEAMQAPHIQKKASSSPFGSLAHIAGDELETAIHTAEETIKTTPLTTWKNRWLVKNEENSFVFAGSLENKRIQALADVCEQYQLQLAAHGWYDFDDMIIRAIQALETHADLRYTLQEQYLYILLDEFQDTNAAQLKLIEYLTDNPVHEGRPNVMAVGDDDQAIYAFQGAQYSNMRDFYQMYRDCSVITLTENYRSRPGILETSGHIAEQIKGRLSAAFPDLTKTLVAQNSNLPSEHISREEFRSDIAQNAWIAEEIDRLVTKGTPPHEIAILAPNHKYLTALVPYLNAKKIPVRYEKRENILDTPIVKELLLMCRLVLALGKQDEATADALWPEVLSLPFWRIPIASIWQVSWEASDSKDLPKKSWAQILLEKSEFRMPALLFLTLAYKIETESCEAMLDYLIGSEAVTTNDPELSTVRSPLRAFYTTPDLQTEHPEQFYATLSHLTVLRAKLREHQELQEEALRLSDLISFVDMYTAAGERMTNTSPYTQDADAVQLMTVFKAKGLEFEQVFLIGCQDEVWGSRSRGNNNKLTLPPNLSPIRHAGATDDERLRILFVAVTRAKAGLYITSYTQTYTGAATKRLVYLDEIEQPDGSYKALILPSEAQTVHVQDTTAPTLETLGLDWRAQNLQAITPNELQNLLGNRLENYQLSATHLNTFTDMEHGGPTTFFFNTILRFPQALSVSGQFGTAVHETMEWYQQQFSRTGTTPSIDSTLQRFELHLRAQKILPEAFALELERGKHALTTYLKARSASFDPSDKPEYNFAHEGSHLEHIRLSGKVDRLHIDPKAKTITVIDYKTGTGTSRWSHTLKLHKYAQQLYCYKILIENSHTFRSYTVTEGRLEFIEPDNEGKCHSLTLTFKDSELQATKELLQAMWNHVQQFNFPDTSDYAASLAGTLNFEQDLREGKI